LSGQTNDEVNMELFTSLGNENKFEKNTSCVLPNWNKLHRF